MSVEVQGSVGVTRDELVRAGLGVVADSGLGGLSMRTLADRLGVKAASLYWHVRDRDELVDWLAAALLDEVDLPVAGSWRPRTLAVAEALDAVLRGHRGGADVLLAAGSRLAASPPSAAARSALEEAGLSADTAAGVASMLLGHVVLVRRNAELQPPSGAGSEASRAAPLGASPVGRPATLTVENLSRGIRVVGVSGLGRLAVPVSGAGTSASVAIHGDGVVVRRLRGAGLAEVRLDATAVWSVRVKGPAWRIRLDLAGLAVERIEMNGGARDVDVVLPAPPAGTIAIGVSGGASQIRLHRPPGAGAAATVHAGALAVRLDGQSLMAALLNDWQWTSAGESSGGRIELDVSGGAADVSLDAAAPTVRPSRSASAAEPERWAPWADIELLLDGVERRIAASGGARG